MEILCLPILNVGMSGSGQALPVALTITYTATQFVFKFKLPSTKSVTLHWGDGTSEAVVGTDAALITKTSAYAGAGTYPFYLTGDVTELTYVDINNQAFVSGSWSGWNFSNLTYLDVGQTGTNGNIEGFAALTSMTVFNVDSTTATGNGATLVNLTSLTSFLFNSTSVTWGSATTMSLTSATVNAANSGMSTSTQVDNFIDSFKGSTGSTFNVAGTNDHRTAASNNDLNTLYANGNTITLNDTLGVELHTSLNAANDSATQAVTAFSDYAATIDGATKVDSAIDFLSMVPQGATQNVSNFTNVDYTSFANGTPTGFDATSNGSGTDDATSADEISYEIGKYYVATFDEVLNSGTAPNVVARESTGGGATVSDNPFVSASGSNVYIFRALITTTGTLRFSNVGTTTDFEITNLNVRELQVLGSDLVTNGDFAADTDWTKGAGWSIAAGVATQFEGGGTLFQTGVVTGGEVYLVKWTLSGYVAGEIRLRAGDGTTYGTEKSANGTYSELIIPDVSGYIGLIPSVDGDFDVDNISVHKLTFTKEIAASTNYTGVHYCLPVDENDFIIPVTYAAEGIVAQLFGGETNGTTGWTAESNAVLSSVDTPVSVGEFSMEIEGNTTPTNNSACSRTFVVDDGSIYRVSCRIRHIGSNGLWRMQVEAQTVLDVIDSDTSYQDAVYYRTMTDVGLTVRFREQSATNNGGVYFDNLSVRKVTFV